MPYTLYPNVSVKKAIAVLEKLGVYGAVVKDKKTLKLYMRKTKRIDPETGEEIVFRPEELLTMDKRNKLENQGWRIGHSSAFGFGRWTHTWQG